MTAVLVLRGLDIFFHRFRTSPSDTPAREIRRFGIGLITASAALGGIPAGIPRALESDRAGIYSDGSLRMVGGSATVLAPSRRLSLVFCAFLVLPASIRFLSLAGDANKFFGILGCFFFLVMLASSRVAHRAIMDSVRLSRTNEALLLAMQDSES